MILLKRTSTLEIMIHILLSRPLNLFDEHSKGAGVPLIPLIETINVWAVISNTTRDDLLR